MQITNNKNTSSFLNNTVSWEDFLDLSKWRAPVTSVVLERRLFDNIFYFSSNYIWIWLVLSFTWGLWVNWKVLASFVIIAIAWFGSSEFVKSSSSSGGGNTKTKLDEKKSSSSLMMVSDTWWYTRLCLFLLGSWRVHKQPHRYIMLVPILSLFLLYYINLVSGSYHFRLSYFMFSRHYCQSSLLGV